MPISTSNETDTNVKRWAADVLGREQLAEFLTASLVEQAKILASSRGAGLTVALDADWGTGKSFFIKHWASDLEKSGHPVVIFDAWENDIGDEAAVAMMACIKSGLEKWTDKLPKKAAVRDQAMAATKSAIKGLRRAIAPTSKVIAAGVLKKATGIAVNEIFDAYNNQAPDESTERISSATSSTLEAGLDELFVRALEDHHKRASAINSFKTSIGNLIDLLEKDAKASTPVFVFVDEVDRCRPTYAIRLLEEIKHIFGVAKVCFVVSTNLDQLRESVCAIYGNGFDGHRYLKRFFDYQYTLPDPDNERFAAQLLAEESSISTRKIAHGLPARPGNASTARSIAIISTAYELDLRSQKQVFSMANSVAAAIPHKMQVFSLWLFFLCALRHKKPQLFQKISGNKLDHSKFIDICQEAFKKDVEIEYSSSDSLGRNQLTRKAKISEVAWAYYDWSFDDLIKLHERRTGENRYHYPASNLGPIVEEMPNTYNLQTKYAPSIAKYAEWVKYAGLAYEHQEE